MLLVLGIWECHTGSLLQAQVLKPGHSLHGRACAAAAGHSLVLYRLVVQRTCLGK